MDISDNFEYQPQQQQQADELQQQQQQHQMQCDPIFTTPNGFAQPTIPASNTDIMSPCVPLQLPMPTAIPLPPAQPFDQPKNSSLQASTARTSTDIEIDSLLLQQFSCLGTTDHEDLINQFQSLMNNQMNKDSAKFFLEMSNWNLQTAVGCYLDYCNFQPIPSMKILQQSRPNEFQQAWRLQNDGTEDWPNGCYLMSPCQKRRIVVPSIKPGETCDILADIPPTQPAVMWRLCTPNGWYFGESIWMLPPGSCHTQADLAQLRTHSNSTNPDSFPQVNVVISVNME